VPQPEYPSQECLATHVTASRYFLQVVKCDNKECCAPFRSSLKTVLPYGFLPLPLCVINSAGLNVASDDDEGHTFFHCFIWLQWCQQVPGPYNACCPIVSDFIANRICRVCKLYFPSNAMIIQHKRQMHPKVKLSEVPRTDQSGSQHEDRDR